MSLAIVHTRARLGIQAPAVTVEVHFTNVLATYKNDTKHNKFNSLATKQRQQSYSSRLNLSSIMDFDRNKGRQR